MSSLQRIRPWLLPIGVMGCLVVLLVPLPTMLMDLLLASNLALAVVILLTTIHVATPLEFSVFPTLLLATTLSRLVLNIATTRLILTNAPGSGELAAGGVIQTFGRFVAGNQIEVGLVLFLILVVVQFVVITKGATRISEVAARFSLDGMPGRQSAIDADLNAGNLDAASAAKKREDLIAEADFFAAMDGAGKFVRGDAIAGLVITAINILGGLYLGIFVSGMDVATAASVFTKLTIGDGLVSQIPSLLISLSAGILVTRGSRRTNLADNFVTQLLGNSRAMMIAGGFLLLLVITGLPAIPLILLGGGFILIATTLDRNQKQQADAERQRIETEMQSSTPAQKRVEDFLAVDPLEVAIGLGLLPLADPSRGGDLMQRIAGLRNQMAAEIGIVLPKVRVRDDAALGQQSYEIRLFGDFVARGELRVDRLMASSEGRTTGELEGERISELGGNVVTWIDPGDREQAMIYGFETRTAPGVLADHLEQVARDYAGELLSHDATKHLLDELRQVAPALVNDLVPNKLSIADVQRVLQGLLHEAIPIRQLGIILEAIGEAASHCSESEDQIEIVRRRLARTLCTQLRDGQRVLRVVTLDNSLAGALTGDGVRQSNSGDKIIDSNIRSDKTRDVTCDEIRRAVKKLTNEGYPPVLLVLPQLRRRVKQATEAAGIWTHVLSTNEITNDTQLVFHTTAGDHPASVAA